jgi:hypothetical protein
MSCVLTVGPITDNIESELKLAFGNSVSIDKVIEFAKRNSDFKKEAGLISNEEAIKIVEQVETKMKAMKGLQGH